MRELSDGERERLAGLKIDQAVEIIKIVPWHIRQTSENNLLKAKEEIACALKLMDEAIDLGANEFREARIRDMRREEIERHRDKLRHKIVKPYEGTVEELKSMSVDELELTVRASNCLKKRNINTVYELTQYTLAELAKARNIGKKNLDEIESKLAEIGLMLKQEEV